MRFFLVLLILSACAQSNKELQRVWQHELYALDFSNIEEGEIEVLANRFELYGCTLYINRNDNLVFTMRTFDREGSNLCDELPDSFRFWNLGSLLKICDSTECEYYF